MIVYGIHYSVNETTILHVILFKILFTGFKNEVG
jgi:hypothetical protein